MLVMLNYIDEISIKMSKLYSYTSLMYDSDISNTKYQAMQGENSVDYSKIERKDVVETNTWKVSDIYAKVSIEIEPFPCSGSNRCDNVSEEPSRERISLTSSRFLSAP